MTGKSPDAFRTISEVADWLDRPAHVLRFWESKFTQVKPVKRAGGRRYYRPEDMRLLGGIKKLLHDDGMTIKGAQKVLREQGVRYVSALSQPLDEDGVLSGVTSLVQAGVANVDTAPVQPPSAVTPKPHEIAPEPTADQTALGSQPAPEPEPTADPVAASGHETQDDAPAPVAETPPVGEQVMAAPTPQEPRDNVDTPENLSLESAEPETAADEAADESAPPSPSEPEPPEAPSSPPAPASVESAPVELRDETSRSTDVPPSPETATAAGDTTAAKTTRPPLGADIPPPPDLSSLQPEPGLLTQIAAISGTIPKAKQADIAALIDRLDALNARMAAPRKG